MNQIKRVRKANEDRLMKLKNVVAIGIGDKLIGGKKTGRLCVRVYVEKKLNPFVLAKRHMVPDLLGSVETDVIEIGKIKALGYTERMRPTKCGISIGHKDITAGTLGCLVKDMATQEIMILSNNHVLANSNKAKIGDEILQPGPHDKGIGTDLIAVLAKFTTIKYKNWWQYFCFWIPDPKNKVDCAVASPLDEKDILPEILEIGIPKGTAAVKVGTKLQKTGRTTGHTKGEVIDDDVTVSVDYGSFIARFENQIMADAMSAGGDSGSLVLDENKNAVGLLFAGSEKTTIINPIQEVLDALDVRIVKG